MGALDSGRQMTVRAHRSASTTRAALALALSAVAALVAGPGLAQAATTRPSPRPDLVVKQGALSLSKGRLVASFQVKNTGSAKAGASTAAVSTVIAGKPSVLKRRVVSSLKPGRSGSVTLKIVLTTTFSTGAFEITACADQLAAVKERSEVNNCLDLGRYAGGTVTETVKPTPIARPADVPAAKVPAPTPAPAPTGPAAPVSATPKPVATPVPAPAPTPTPAVTPTPTPAPPTVKPRPASTVPSAPLANINTDDATKIDSPAGTYWVFQPNAYDQSGNTPIRLLVWMHGCGGMASGDIYTASVGGDAQKYFTMSPVGPDGGAPTDCWDVNTDPAKVWAMIADLETHFNIDRRRIVLGGYSSGGDMTYRMAFDDAYDVAGVLVENSSPFGDSGLDSSALGKAYWKFNVQHLAHTGDDVYPIDTVRQQIGQLKSAGFPAELTEQPGGHGDYPKVDDDVRTYLLPHMNDDWLAPAGP